MKKIRQSTVEPVLGTLINFMAMRRVNTRGKDQATKCMLMAAVAYNIKKAMKFTKKKVMTAIMPLSQAPILQFSELFSVLMGKSGFRLT
jgi:hypothetical protein